MSDFEELNDEELKEEIRLTESIRDNLLEDAHYQGQYLTDLEDELVARKRKNKET